MHLANEAHVEYVQKCEEYVRDLYDLCESSHNRSGKRLR